MTLPSFSIEDDPGPNFAALIKGYGIEPLKLQNPVDNLAHGTTCVAIRFEDGVILAGDRRATSGHHISHRTLDKVFQSDYPLWSCYFWSCRACYRDGETISASTRTL